MADYPSTYFAVKCDSAHNRVLIRFVVIDGYLSGGTITPQDFTDAPGTMYEVPSLPTSLKARWKGMPYHNQSKCTLRNGQKISLSQEGSVTGPGTGEWIANVSFTMKINSHFIYIDSPFFQGNGRHLRRAGLLVSAIEYTGKKLLICYPVEKNKQGAARPGSNCVDDSKRLLPGYKYLTQGERNALERYRRKKHLEATTTPLCKTLFAALNAKTPPLGVKFYFEKRHYLGAPNGYTKLYYSTNHISIHNDGLMDYVVEFGFYNTDSILWNKSFLFSFGSNKAKYENFVKYLTTTSLIELSDWYIDGVTSKRFFPWNKYVIGISEHLIRRDANFDWYLDFIMSRSGRSGAGFITTAIGRGGIVYIYTMPNVLRDKNDVPTGVIVKLMPDKSQKLVCAFPEAIEPDSRF